MAIDAGIYSQIQQPQPQNQLATLAQAYQVKGLQSQLDRADRAEQQQNRLLALVQSPEFSKMDAQGKAGALQGVGDFDNAGKVITADAAANKDRRAAEVSGLDMKIKQLDAAANIAGTVTDQASYDRALPMMRDLGFDISKFSPQYNPQGVAQFAQATLSAKERLANQTQIRGQDLTAQTSRANNANTVGATMRGQDMTDARSRESNTNSRVPSGYRLAADGQTLEFIPGGPADPQNKAGGGKPLTEGQSKSLLFASRMQEANAIFDELEKEGTTKAIPGSTTPYIGGAVTALSGATNQKLVQAKRDFLNATLRKESGAVISDQEFKNGDQQYFPQIGDSPEVIAQKKRNREIAVRGIAADVPDSDNRLAQVRGPKAGGVMKVTNADDYAKVPSGATYTTPDGKTRRKP